MLASGLMSKRRTRKEKELAAQRTVLLSQDAPENGPVSRSWLAIDLTRTIIVTILAVITQLAVAYYLNHGGWKFILERR